MTGGVPTIEDLLAATGLSETQGEFVLLRRDFSHVVYLMAKDLSEAAAGVLVAHFTGLGHHQFYWAERPAFDPGRFERGDIVPVRAVTPA